jgi:hypothetical protein
MTSIKFTEISQSGGTSQSRSGDGLLGLKKWREKENSLGANGKGRARHGKEMKAPFLNVNNETWKEKRKEKGKGDLPHL